jgi:hypothetical protein
MENTFIQKNVAANAADLSAGSLVKQLWFWDVYWIQLLPALSCSDT